MTGLKLNILFGDLTQNNIKKKDLRCCRCGEKFGKSQRVDTLNLNDTEMTYCFRDYEKELKKPETPKERAYWESLRKKRK